MKKELNHYYIGESYGGNQDWFRTYWMRLGGCGAETACECSIYFAREFEFKSAYPFDANSITKREYVDFAHIMEPYLRPRLSGINKLSIFVEGYGKYLKNQGIDGIKLSEFSGERTYDEAREIVKQQIDKGMPLAFLTLRHRNKKYEDYVWHWYLVNGYDETREGLKVKAVTYSEYEWLDLRELWDTRSNPKGGIILFDGTNNR